MPYFVLRSWLHKSFGNGISDGFAGVVGMDAEPLGIGDAMAGEAVMDDALGKEAVDNSDEAFENIISKRRSCIKLP